MICEIADTLYDVTEMKRMGPPGLKFGKTLFRPFRLFG
jgi:hypothetical protein